MAWDSLANADRSQLLGDVMLFAAATLWSAYAVLARVRNVSALQAAAFVAVISSVVYLPVYVALGRSNLIDASPPDLMLQALFQGVVIGVVSIFAYTRATALLGPTSAALLTTIVPTITAVTLLPDREMATVQAWLAEHLLRRQCGTSHLNRRVINRSCSRLPADGRSANCRVYRLWIRRAAVPHKGHSAVIVSERTARTIKSDESLTPSNAKPLGTSDETRKSVRMVLIPHSGITDRQSTSSKVSQSQSWTPIGGKHHADSHSGYEMLALSAYIALQSRGEPITPPMDAKLESFRERSAAHFSISASGN